VTAKHLTWISVILTLLHSGAAESSDSETPSFREIAAVLASAYVGSVPVKTEVFLGEATDTKRPCSPPQSTVVGGFFQSGSSMWIFRIPAPGYAARDSCRSELLEAGWKMIGSQAVGLQDLSDPLTLCTSDRYRSIELANTNNRTYLLVNSSAYSGPCKSGSVFDTTTDDFPIDIPLLTPPEKATAQSHGVSYTGVDSYDGSQRIFGGGTPVELIRHYRRQLTEQGWTLVDESELERIAILVLGKPDRSGTPWSAELIAVQRGSGVEIFFNMNTEKPH